MGKTRLAIEVADEVVGHFADGTVFVDLAPLRDPGLVLSAIARQLGVNERDAIPLAALLAAALRARQLLVPLDNFEHLLAARIVCSLCWRPGSSRGSAERPVPGSGLGSR